jgi:epoxyqueuosine reductase QueG
MMLDNAKVLEVREATMEAVKDAVKAQIAKGSPTEGMPKARHIVVVAYALDEVLGAYCGSGDEDERRAVLKAALSGSLLNASQLRQELEKAGVLTATKGLTSQYDV